MTLMSLQCSYKSCILTVILRDMIIGVRPYHRTNTISTQTQSVSVAPGSKNQVLWPALCNVGPIVLSLPSTMIGQFISIKHSHWMIAMFDQYCQHMTIECLYEGYMGHQCNSMEKFKNYSHQSFKQYLTILILSSC